MKAKGEGIVKLFLSLLLVSLCQVKTSWASDTSEALIEVNLVNHHFTTAILASETRWCSPATLVGPRVFVTAAHCVHLIPDTRILSVVGPSFREDRRVKAVHIMDGDTATDEEFFNGKDCKKRKCTSTRNGFCSYGRCGNSGKSLDKQSN